MKRSGLPLNDVHSELNETHPLEVLAPSSVEHLSTALKRAAAKNLPVIPFGGRHAMGGQQFREGGLCLDLTGLRRQLEFDRDRGLIRFEAGAMWPDVVQATQDTPWAIRQKQTGADDLTLRQLVRQYPRTRLDPRPVHRRRGPSRSWMRREAPFGARGPRMPSSSHWPPEATDCLGRWWTLPCGLCTGRHSAVACA